MLTRDVAPHNRNFESWMGEVDRSLGYLHRRPVAQADENGEIRLGDAILRFDTQSDGTVEVTMRNAITDGSPVRIAVLP